jgi:hypothetical protein
LSLSADVRSFVLAELEDVYRTLVEPAELEALQHAS